MKPPVVKICGLTRSEDVACAINEGADYLGLNFYPPSPRCLPFKRAARLADYARQLADEKRVGIVAVMVDMPASQIQEMIAEVNPDILQFHGKELPDFCRSFGLPSMKAFRIGEEADLQALKTFPAPPFFARLVDAKAASAPGGTGLKIPLALARVATQSPRVFLAGGLTPTNVAQAITNCQPFGVDVASGVESQPGLKCSDRIASFMNAVRETHLTSVE